MSTYDYEQERQRRRAEWESAPKTCPYCHSSINQRVSEYSNGLPRRPRKNCGSDRCRQATSRKDRAERKRIEREQTAQRIDRYAARFPKEQRAALLRAKTLLMWCDYDQGHNVMWQVIRVIETQRCKHGPK